MIREADDTLTIFERSKAGRRAFTAPPLDGPAGGARFPFADDALPRHAGEAGDDADAGHQAAGDADRVVGRAAVDQDDLVDLGQAGHHVR